MNYEFKEAKISDLKKGLLELYIDGYNFHQLKRPDIFKEKTTQELEDDLINSIKQNNQTFLLLMINNTIIGYLSYRIKERNSINNIWIDELVIDKKYRHQGYGKLLFNKLKSIGIKQNCQHIELNCWSFNADALLFYNKLQFNNQRVILEYDLSENNIK